MWGKVVLRVPSPRLTGRRWRQPDEGHSPRKTTKKARLPEPHETIHSGTPPLPPQLPDHIQTLPNHRHTVKDYFPMPLSLSTMPHSVQYFEYFFVTEAVLMDFFLTYRGPLRATQRDPVAGSSRRTSHWQLKHSMRRKFHPQLLTIWKTHPLLIDKQTEPGSVLNVSSLSEKHKIGRWSFVPLVTQDLQITCLLEITLLRLDHPGSSVWSGDIDNRVKTIIDALEVPSGNCGYDDLESQADDNCNPLFCLIDSDKLFTKVSVETGRLLFAPSSADPSFAEVTIRVRTSPTNVTMLNIGF